MATVFKSKLFWGIAILSAIIFFLAGNGSTGTYQTETEILILPKSETATRNINQIIANAKEIPLSLSFYNKLVEHNSDIEDTLGTLSDYDRKKSWNSKIETKKTGKSGIVSIKIFDGNQSQAEIINRQVRNDLVIVMSKYYNIKTDIDIRFIDGPITNKITKTNYLLWILLSLAVGFLLGIIAYLISVFFPKMLDRMKLQIKNRQESRLTSFFKKDFTKEKPMAADVEYVFPPKEKPTSPFEPEKEIKTEEQRTKDEIKKRNIDQSKKASAPENLPIAGEDIMSLFGETKAEEKKEKPQETKDVHREPTEEEVRERLNKLLGGGMLK